MLGVDAGMDKPIQLFLINNTAQQVVYTLFTIQDGMARGRLWGHLDAASAQFLFSARALDDIAQLVVQLLPFHTTAALLAEPLQTEIRLRPKHLLKERTFVPYLDRDLVTLALPAPQPPPTGGLPSATPKALRPADFSPFDRMKEDLNIKQDVLEAARPESVVDLHLDKLLNDPYSVDAATALALQLESFEKCLSLAMAHQLPEIIFIHGIGTGRLKAEMHKRLEGYASVREYYVDTTKRFGGGATVVKL